MRKTIKNYTKNLICLALSAVTAYSATACRKGDSITQESLDYTLWSAPATVKVLRDAEKATYADVSGKAEIVVDTAKNEYEGAQILITANSAVKNYTVTLSDLKNEDGSVVYSKDNIAVYNMKYCFMSSSWNEGSRVGWYPDAVLPFENAIQANENKVEKGDNQSVYFTFNTPATQETGTYTGSITLTVEGEKNEIPVCVRVRNVEVNETVHNKSFFLTHWYTYLGEYDSTQATLDKYTKALYDYRLAPANLVVDTAYQQEDADYYAEKAYELCANESCSTIGIPVRKLNDGIPGGQMTMYIKSLTLKSLETKYNLISKCYVYGIDEPIQTNSFEKTKAFAATFYAQRKEAKEYFVDNREDFLTKNPNVSSEWYDQVVADIDNIRYITTTQYKEEYVDYVDIWCPHFNTFESGEAAGLYDGEDKMWFYGCLTPRAPYPTYHIDDTLLSARMVGWLQSIYNVEGNLYWAVNNFARYDGAYSYLDEYYDNPNHFNYVPGEGFLFYPGKMYGVDGPIASIRLEAIRDGYEEYELLYNIKEQYSNISKQIGVDFAVDSTIEALAKGLHSGMKVTATTESFASARAQLLSLSEFSQSGVCFTNYADDGEGMIEYSIYVPNGTSVRVDGLTQKSEFAVTGGKVISYYADMKQSGAASVASFTTDVDGETVSVSFNLSGAVKKFEGEQLNNLFSGSIIDAETKLIDAIGVNGDNGKLLNVSLAAATDMARARITLMKPDVLSEFNSTTEKTVWNWYYTGKEDLSVKVYIKYKKSTYPQELGTVITFKEGANSIVLDGISKLKWDRYGEVEYIFFDIGDFNQPARKDLYLKNIVIYKVQGGGE